MNNALRYVKLLEGTGIAREQAEAHVQIMSELLEENLATKQDIKNLETKLDISVARLDTSIERLEHKLDTSIERLDHKLNTSIENLDHRLNTSVGQLEHKMIQLEYRLIIKLGSIVTVAIAASTAIIKLL